MTEKTITSTPLLWPIIHSEEKEYACIYSASVLDRLNALLEPGGSLTITERGVIDGQIPCIKPHPDFR